MFESTLRTLIVIIFLSAVILFTSLIRNDNNSQSQADLNTPLPEFTLRTLHLEKKITNEDLGDLFVLNVWASWCITCRIEHPYLMNLNNNGIPIIGLNYKDERDDAINWLNKYGNPYDLTVHDFKGTLALDLGVTGAPETFLVHNGKVVAHYQGEVNKLIWEDVFLPVIKEKEIF